MRATIASNSARSRLDSNLGSSRGAGGCASGSGPARRARVSRIAWTARAWAVSTPVWSSRYALARIVTVCLRWSNATTTSESISAMSGSPSTSGLGSGRRSTARTQSKPKKPTAPPANGGRPATAAWQCSETAWPAIAYGSPPSWRLHRSTRRGRQPMKLQRPTRWPCSADSSRNAGPSPRSFRNAETGVSQSSMKLWRTGIRLCSPASCLASSSVGVTVRCSATAANEHLLGVREAQSAAPEQHGEVVEDVGGFLGDALVGLLACGADDLLGLLLDLLADPGWILQERRRVGGLRHVLRPLLQRSFQARKRLVGHPLELPVVKARALAGVARRAGGLDEREHRVGIAVVAQRLHGLSVAGRRALAPQLVAGAAVEVELAGFAREPQRLLVHVREREDLAGAPILDHARHEASLVEVEFGVLHRDAGV